VAHILSSLRLLQCNQTVLQGLLPSWGNRLWGSDSNHFDEKIQPCLLGRKRRNPSPQAARRPYSRKFFQVDVTEPIFICALWRVAVVLPLLLKPKAICKRLHIEPPTLRRWEAKGAIPFHPVGPARRYLEWEVEQALQKNHRFGPPLAPHIGIHILRERVGPEFICKCLVIDRKTLERRMDDGIIPYYRIGQTYLFAPDEVLYSLGISAEAFASALPSPSATPPAPTAASPASPVSPGGCS